MKRALAIVVGCLFSVWLASLAVLLLFLADLTTVPFLVGALIAQIGVAAVSAGILLVTNTRRAWPHDDYSATTDELLRAPVMLPDGLAYGRRKVDDRNVVARLSDILEEEADRRKPSETPAWVVSMNQRHADAATIFPEGPDETRA